MLISKYIYDRGALCYKYRIWRYAGRPTDAKKERAPKRTFGNRLAGSSENIRPAVAFLRSAIFLIKQLFER